MSKLAKQIKAWYEGGNWTLAQVRNALLKGRITRAEYREITGEDADDE